MKRISRIIPCILFFMTPHMQATVFGSDTAIQAAQPFFTFPSGQTNNRLANYGWAANGFAIANATTSAEFDSVFPVSGPIQLNGGTLTLNRDLLFNNTTILQGMGAIVGQTHMMTLGSTTTGLPSSKSFQDTTLVLNSDITLTSAITFTGTCTIEGNGHQLILGSVGGIKVGNNSTLQLHNVVVNGVAGSNVQCLNDSSLLILNDTSCIFSSNATFTLGAFQCRNDVEFVGPHTFAYQSLKTSLIMSNAMLILDQGFTFSYDATRSASKTFFQFNDETASMFLNGATLHATTTGLNLTHGTLIARGDCGLSSEIKKVHSAIIDNGITIGDGTSADDFAIIIQAGSQLLVSTGSINYYNVNAASWLMENSLSTLHMGPSTTLRLYQTLNLGTGLALCENGVTIARKSAAQLLGNTTAVGNLFFAQL